MRLRRRVRRQRRGEEGSRQGREKDGPGDDGGGGPGEGEGQRLRRLAGEADPLPALGWKGWQPADDEPERPAGAVRLRGDAVQGDREGARRLEVTVLKLTLEYDGTDFVGWQMQPNGRIVQQELEKGLQRLCGEPVRVTGAGRTDAGVHARGQVASLRPPRELPLKAWTAGLHALLPDDLPFLRVEVALDAFDARHLARGQSNTLAILAPLLCSPLE